MFMKFNELLIVLSMLRRPRFEALLFQRTAIQKLTSRLSTSGEQARLPGTLAEEQMSNQLRHISLGCILGEGITRVYLGWCLSRYKSIQTCIYICGGDLYVLFRAAGCQLSLFLPRHQLSIFGRFHKVSPLAMTRLILFYSTLYRYVFWKE